MQVEAVEHAVKTDQQTRRKIFEEEIDMIAHEEVKQFLLKSYRFITRILLVWKAYSHIL